MKLQSSTHRVLTSEEDFFLLSDTKSVQTQGCSIESNVVGEENEANLLKIVKLQLLKSPQE